MQDSGWMAFQPCFVGFNGRYFAPTSWRWPKAFSSNSSTKTHDSFGDIDSIPPNARLFSLRTAWYTFEDNEAEVKQMNKGRSLAMRHVSRKHRVDLDRLFDCINLDPMIQIKYVNTTRQFTDILTRGSFTRDRWTPLTLLVNIMTHTTSAQSNLSVSSVVVNPLFSSMSKRAGESCAASASAKQEPVRYTLHRQWLRGNWTTRMPTWTITQFFHQITKLESTPSVKNCVSKMLKNPPWSSIKLRATGGGWSSIKILATGSHERSVNAGEVKVYPRRTLMENNTSEKSMIQQKAVSLRTRRNNNSTWWCWAAKVKNMGRTTHRLSWFSAQHSDLASSRATSFGLHFG